MQFRFLRAHTPLSAPNARSSKADWPLSAVATTDAIRSLPPDRGPEAASRYRFSPSALAAAALSLSLLLSVMSVAAPALHAQAAQTQKNWKDRAEYDLYVSITQASDPAKRLQLLDQWKDKYPQSDYNKERLQFYVATTAAASQPQKTLQYAAELLKVDPKDFTSLYYTALFGPGVYGNSPSADQQAQVTSAAQGLLEGVDAAFDASKKPKTMTDEQWTAAKNSTAAVGHNALGWVAMAKKDWPTAEKEYTTSLQLNPANGQVIYTLAGVLKEEKKYVPSIFYFARAGAYDGPSALPPDARPKVLSYLKDKLYVPFHGSADGFDAVVAAAKTNATPPAGFDVTSIQAVVDAQAKQLQAYLDANADVKLWYTVQQALIADGGQAYFDANVKDADLPGGANDVKVFKGIVVSMDPPEKPTKIMLDVFDSANPDKAKPETAATDKPDATLIFGDPVTAPVKVGDVIEFSGVADSFTKDPYMLTFTDPNCPALKPAAKPRPPRKRSPAKKG